MSEFSVPEPNEAKIVAGLTKRKGWISSLSNEKRASIIMRLLDIIDDPDAKTRDIVRATTALARFDQLDIEHAKLEMQTEEPVDNDADQQPFEYHVVDGREDINADEDAA